MRNNTKITGVFTAWMMAGTLTNCWAADTGNDAGRTQPAPIAADKPDSPKTDTTTAAGAGSPDGATADSGSSGKILLKPGINLEVGTDTEDIHPTYDVNLARQQRDKYPDSPEAVFILAVALTRTSHVEEALKEVQHARRLANANGGATYFDKMIEQYELSLKSYPNDNEVRYSLAWAYYMKAYLLAEHSRRTKRWKDANPELARQLAASQAVVSKTAAGISAAKTPSAPNGAGAAPGLSNAASAANNRSAGGTQAANPLGTAGTANGDLIKAALGGSPVALAGIASAVLGGNVPANSLPHIPGALENVEPADISQIRNYYELALNKLDELIKRDPGDIRAAVYRAHLQAEYTGNLAAAMQTWQYYAQAHPDDPAPHFFLGEGYLKQGNLRESLNQISRALQLRSIGM